jgi:hypothetical protein
MMQTQEMIACAEGKNNENTLLRTCRFLTAYLQLKRFNKETAWKELNVINAIITRDFYMPGKTMPKHIVRAIFRLNSMLRARGLPRLHTEQVLINAADTFPITLVEIVAALRRDISEN